MQRPGIIYYRKFFQLFGVLFLAAIPLLDLFRLELGKKQFLLLGQRFFVQQMYLLVIAFTLLLILLVVFSRIFGRIWCGWFCPQNTWAEIGNYLLKMGRKKHKTLTQLASLIGMGLLVVLMTLIFSFIIMSFFIAPKELWQQISTGNVGGFVAISVVKLTVFGIANMFVIGHSFCWNICPYALAQQFFTTKDTLRIAFNPETCTDCKRCERVCTMRLQPRYLDEKKDGNNNCINCGACMIACNDQAARSKIDSSLGYSGGRDGKSLRTILVPDGKTILTGLIFIIMAAGIVSVFSNHQGIDISLNNELREEITLEDGWIENYYLIKLRSTREHAAPLEISVTGLGESAQVSPTIFYPSGLLEEVIKIGVRTKAAELDTPLLPIKIVVSTQLNKGNYYREIKASFYYKQNW